MWSVLSTGLSPRVEPAGWAQLSPRESSAGLEAGAAAPCELPGTWEGAEEAALVPPKAGISGIGFHFPFYCTVPKDPKWKLDSSETLTQCMLSKDSSQRGLKLYPTGD